jgi:hypothetical protein
LVPFLELPRHIGGYDIGIAPLADIPVNWCRSDIKVKEYAASGVPWLASPLGPYMGLGEGYGGRLVEDHEWFSALDRLVSSRLSRWWLGRRGRRWARRMMIDSVAGRWEHVFLAAAGHRPMNDVGGLALRNAPPILAATRSMADPTCASE